MVQRNVPKGPDGRRSPIVRQARFNQITVTHFRNDVAAALEHSASRNCRVVQAACYFDLLRGTRHDLRSAEVTIDAAETQLFRSSAGFQAAHYLPGLIKFNSRVPWDRLFVSDPGSQHRLECLFGEVENLPASFNIADSAAEEKGLREAFRRISVEVIRHAPSSGKPVLHRELIRRLYDEVWKPAAAKAYGDAIGQKALSNPVPLLRTDEFGNILNLKERGEADWSRQKEIDILNRYREALREAVPDLRDDKMELIEDTFQT